MNYDIGYLYLTKTYKHTNKQNVISVQLGSYCFTTTASTFPSIYFPIRLGCVESQSLTSLGNVSCADGAAWRAFVLLGDLESPFHLTGNRYGAHREHKLHADKPVVKITAVVRPPHEEVTHEANP